MYSKTDSRLNEGKKTNSAFLWRRVDVKDNVWSDVYRCRVLDGMRIEFTDFKRNIPSYLTAEGVRAVITHEGQPVTCYTSQMLPPLCANIGEKQPVGSMLRVPTRCNLKNGTNSNAK